MTQILAKRPELNDWEVLAEVFYEPIYDKVLDPRVVVRQHRGTKEIRVDVYDCNTGLDVTFTNGGTDDKRAKWFRDVTVTDNRYSPLRVRFLGQDLELRS